MKFIHIADVHWGMNPDSDKSWSWERAQAIKDTFASVIREARERDVDCLFISGDLFHHQPLARDLKELNYLFSTIPSVHVCIIAGNHDRIRKSSALLSFTWAPNVTFFMDEELRSVYFEDINTEVFGMSYHTPEITENRLLDLKAPSNTHTNVLMVHGGDGKHLPFDRANLAASGFSYIALGHIHKPEIIKGTPMAYPGSLEPLDKTETGPHGMLVGELNYLTKQLTSLTFVPMAQAQYISLVIDVTPQTTNMELSQRISEEIQKRGTEHIYRFRIRGMRDPEVSFDLQALEKRLKIVEILDETEPQYDFSALFAEHPSDMIGLYIQALQKDDMSPVEKKAMYYGINALLHTMDERS